jgi:hypothetical protein
MSNELTNVLLITICLQLANIIYVLKKKNNEQQ